MATKAERFSNLGESTLASSYTSGGSSIVVSSAASFPTDGIFRVRLDNPSETIFRVDSVSGTTFTGAAEANDGNASAGVAAVQVGSRQTAERFLQAPITDEPRSPSGSFGTDYYGPLYKLVALDQSGFSWVNQGSATIAQGSGVVYLLIPAAAGTNLRGRFVSSPTPPYTMTIGVLSWFASASSLTSLQYAGIAVRESGTGKLSIIVIANFTFATANQPPSISAANYNSATSFNAVIGTERNSNALMHIVWLRITDNNTNLIFEASLDRVNWYQIASIGRTSFMAGGPDEIGIIGTNQAGSTDMSASFIHWEES